MASAAVLAGMLCSVWPHAMRPHFLQRQIGGDLATWQVALPIGQLREASMALSKKARRARRTKAARLAAQAPVAALALPAPNKARAIVWRKVPTRTRRLGAPWRVQPGSAIRREAVIASPKVPVNFATVYLVVGDGMVAWSRNQGDATVLPAALAASYAKRHGAKVAQHTSER